MNKSSDLLTWLQEWYLAQCSDEEPLETSSDVPYQEAFGVKIDTLDNPGWTVRIDLTSTSLENKQFDKIYVDNDEPEDGDDWYTCDVEYEDPIHRVFTAACGPTHLSTVIGIFKDWTEE